MCWEPLKYPIMGRLDMILISKGEKPTDDQYGFLGHSKP